MTNVAIFASGKGSNAQSIVEYFKNNLEVKVSFILTNNPSAGVLQVAQQNKIVSAIVSKNFFNDEKRMLSLLEGANVQLIVLAGFLQLVPAWLIRAYNNRIVNIHPALLPKYGGKGMYGLKVHEAVIAAGEKQSGITIHYVNEEYDKGEVVLQKTVEVSANDTPASLSEKVLQLEHEWLPQTIQKIAQQPR